MDDFAFLERAVNAIVSVTNHISTVQSVVPHAATAAQNKVGKFAHDVTRINVCVAMQKDILNRHAPKIENRHFGLRLHRQKIMQRRVGVFLITSVFQAHILQVQTRYAVAQHLNAAVNRGNAHSRLCRRREIVHTAALSWRGVYFRGLVRGHFATEKTFYVIPKRHDARSFCSKLRRLLQICKCLLAQYGTRRNITAQFLAIYEILNFV